MFKVDREICIACEQCIKDCLVNDIYLKEGKADIKSALFPILIAITFFITKL